jgi:WD40 repeat protein
MRYDAFISYSHFADRQLAPAIQAGLQRLAKPWNQRRALWIFRDETGLTVSPALFSSIKAALDDSRYLILLLSPSAVFSPWVKREIQHWIATKSAERILLVVTEGEWAWDTRTSDFDLDRSTAIPSALQGVFAEEPLVLDLRWARGEHRLELTDKRFRNAIADLAAPLHGKSKEDLEAEDLRQYHRARRLRFSAASLLALLLVLVLVAGGVAWDNSRRAAASAARARDQQGIAEEQQRRAEQAAAEARKQQALAQQEQHRAEAAAAEARRQQTIAEEQQRRAQWAAAEAQRQAAIAEEQQSLAKRSAAEARKQQALALQEQRRAERAAEHAREQQAIAQAQAELAMSRQLAAQAELQRSGNLALSLLLSVEAQRFAPTVEARSALLAGLEANPHLTTFLRSGARGMRTVALTRDGRTLAAGNDDGTVALVDVPSHRQLGQLSSGTGSQVSSLSFSPDGSTLAAAGGNRRIVLWDARTGQPIGAPLSGHARTVSSLVFNDDGSRLASADNKTIMLWDVAAHARWGRPLSGLNRATTEIGGEVSLAFSPDGDVLASGDSDGAVVLWDVGSQRRIGGPLSTLDVGINKAQVRLSFSPDGRILAAGVDASCDTCGFEPGKIILWDVKSRQPIGEPLTGHVGGINSVDFSSDGRQLVSGGTRDGAILLWDLKGRRSPSRLTSYDDRAVSVAFAGDGRRIVSSDSDGNVALWDTGRQLSLGTLLEGRRQSVTSLAFSPDGRLLATDGQLQPKTAVWDLRSRQMLMRFRDGARSLAFSHSGRLLAQAAADGTLVLWDVPSRRRLGTPAAPNPGVGSVAFTTDDKILISAEGLGIVLRDAHSGRPVARPPVAHTGWIETVAASPDGALFASGGSDGLVVLWSTRTRRPLGPPLQAHGAVSSVAFSPDGGLLASYGINGEIRVWNVHSRKPRGAPLAGPPAAEGSGVSLAFARDSRTLASAGAARIVIWDVPSQRPLGSALAYRDTLVTALAFRPTGGMLASGHSDGTVVLWDVNPWSWARKACVIANRDLSRSEWNDYIGAIKKYRRTCG